MHMSTARESLVRFDRRIAEEESPKIRRWLQVFRDHWWAEVNNDVDAIMATMSRKSISYSFDGHPFIALGGTPIDTFEATKAMYETVIGFGIRIAGPFDNERILADKDGIAVMGLQTAVFPGKFLTPDPEIDPESFYLIRWFSMSVCTFDEDDKMKGEDVVNGAPLMRIKVEADTTHRIFEGPLSDDWKLPARA